MKPKCSVRVQVNKRWRNCPGPIEVTFQSRGEATHLCAKCAAQVAAGSYGSDQRLALISQHPRFRPESRPRLIKLPSRYDVIRLETGQL